MEYQFGRLIDHLHFRAADLKVSKRFYRAVLQALGRELTMEGDHYFCSDELFVTADKPPEGKIHFAFQAADVAAVKRFHQAGIAAGGTDNGAPGDRHYHPGYYSAYVLDPDGNNVEAVFHGAAQRSAESVVVKPAT